MGNRRQSREMVMQVLYAIDMSNDITDADFILTTLCKDKKVYNFASSLLHTTLEHLEKIDELIVKTAANWDLERIAAVDKSILRMAICEICYWDDIPYKVSINEAVEIAKIFGTGKSSSFINGILDHIAQNFNNLLDNNKENLT